MVGDRKMTYTMNEQLQHAGVETVRNSDGVFLKFKDKVITRPHVDNCVEVCKLEFKLDIEEDQNS